MAVSVALFAAGILLGLAGALMWAWGVRTGQFRDLERSKMQVFWPDLTDEKGAPQSSAERRTQRGEA